MTALLICAIKLLTEMYPSLFVSQNFARLSIANWSRHFRLLIARLKLTMLMSSALSSLKCWIDSYSLALSNLSSSAFILISLRLLRATYWSNLRSNCVFISAIKSCLVIESERVLFRKYSLMIITSSSVMEIWFFAKAALSSSAERELFLFKSYLSNCTDRFRLNLRHFVARGLITSSMLRLNVFYSMKSEEIT